MPFIPSSRSVFTLTATGVLALSLTLSFNASAQYGQNYYGSPYGNNTMPQQTGTNLAPLQGHVVTAPAGTFLSASVQSPISSEYARPGDRFTALLGSPIAGNGGVVLPAGSQLEGQVITVKSAGRAGRNGELEVRFTAAVSPNGQRVPLSARIQTEDGTGIIKGGTAAGRAGKAALRTAIGAGSGAALGTAMGPLSGGHVGRGAIYGTAIGGGIGLLSAGVKKGEEAVITTGQPLNIVLDTPITMTAPAAMNVPQQSGYGYDQSQGYNNGYANPYNPAPNNANPYGNPYTQPNNGSGYYGSDNGY